MNATHGESPVKLSGKGVDALYRSGKIGGAEVVAAERWLLDYTLGVHGYFESDSVSSGGGDAHTAGFARAKAKDAYNAAWAAVGGWGDLVLRLFVSRDLPLIALAEVIQLDRKATVGVVVATLRRLAEHYGASTPVGRESPSILSAQFSA